MERTILIVDDEPEISDALKRALAPRGYRVATCSEGRRVMSALYDLKPDLLIMDVMLPGIDGYTLMTRITAEGGAKLSRLPVIVMSALEPSRSMFMGFPQVTAFLSKPFELGDMLAAVERALGGGDAEPEAA